LIHSSIDWFIYGLIHGLTGHAAGWVPDNRPWHVPSLIHSSIDWFIYGLVQGFTDWWMDWQAMRRFGFPTTGLNAFLDLWIHQSIDGLMDGLMVWLMDWWMD
jgi:hypothetical protein